MDDQENKNNNKKLFISHENNYNFQNEIFNFQEVSPINKSLFELKNYYKNTRNITDVMKEEKFNMINEIEKINDSQNIRINKSNNIDEDIKSNSSIESLCPKDSNIYLKPYEWIQILNDSNEKENEKIFNKMIISTMNNEEIINFKKRLEKLNLTGPDCDEKIIFNNIGSLNKYENENEICTTTNNSINKMSKKNENCLMWRKIKGDGNCYYRSVMFALIENIILTKDINYLKKIMINFNEKSKNKILMTMFKGLDLDINLVKKCFIMIYLSLTSKSHEPILKAYIVFFKIINNIKDFDYGLILFFKFILYEYINKNKKSTYSFKFQILIGNLLPNDCQNDDGNFNFSFFYKNYLMKFYQYAEKIIIYLTPFIFGKEIIIKYINENDGMDVDIQQFKFGQNLSYMDFDNNKIELLYQKTHYDLLYNNNYYTLYQNIFKLTLFNFINNFQENSCQICSKNNNKNSILIKLESDFSKKNYNEFNIKKNKIIICYKCLFKEIKQNLTLLFIYFRQKIKKYFLDNFLEHISDFLSKTFVFSDKSMEITYSNAINTLSIYRPKYNYEYIINQIKNEICVCCNANINEKNNYNNKQLKAKIILPCNCILCSENCIKEFYYIIISSAYIKQELICFCNQKYKFEDCLLLIERLNEKKIDCKELIELLFYKKNKNICFLCLKEDKNNKICLVIEPKFYLNHIIKHYICENCYNKNENYLGQNIKCGLCKRNHIIDKFCDKLKDELIKGYDFESSKKINENNKDKVNLIKVDEEKKIREKIIKDEDINLNTINNDNNNISKNNISKNNINNKINKNIDNDDKERVTVIKIHKKKKNNI